MLLLLVSTAVADILNLVDAGLPIDAYIAAFGDFNADKHSDVVAIKRINHTSHLEVYEWSSATSKFSLSSQISIIVEEAVILNAAPGDFNMDGRLDLLVSVDNAGVVGLHMYLYIPEGKWGRSVISPSARGQVLVMDYDNNLVPDLYGVSAVTGNRTFWLNSGSGTFTTVEQTIPRELLGSFTDISSHVSHAFVDLNGDCLADLFVTARNPHTGETRFEMWLNQNNDYVLHAPSLASILPPGLGQVTFADVDADGTMDLLFPICFPASSCAETNSLHIFYNVQKPMCDSVWDKDSSSCRAQDNLCSADPKFQIGNFSILTGNFSLESRDHVIVSSQAFLDQKLLFNPDAGVAGTTSRIPITLRVGDVDMDRYVDVLISVKHTEGGHSAVTLWESEPCSMHTCAPAAVSAGRRTFVHREAGTAGLTSQAGAFAGTFFDLSDDGNLDVFLNVALPGGGVAAKALTNNYEEDAFFFTTLGSNGVCPAWCPSPLKTFPDVKPYGVNQVGMSVKFTVADLNGKKQLHQGCQLSQSVHLSLQTPYNFFGLGRTNNYIEWFYAGFPLRNPNKNGGLHYKSWVTLIPNAQIFIFPFDPWSLELFVPPSSRLLAVSIAIAVALGILAAIVCRLHRKQLREEVQEKDEKLIFKF